MALGEALAVVAIDQRDMPPARMRHAERARDQLLPRGAREEVVAAHDIGHAVARVVDHDRELVRGHAELGPHDHVACFKTWVEHALAEQLVVHAFGRRVDEHAVVRLPGVDRAGPRVGRP